jgi:hypothetical protein
LLAFVVLDEIVVFPYDFRVWAITFLTIITGSRLK